jgi:hypothetical protein
VQSNCVVPPIGGGTNSPPPGGGTGSPGSSNGSGSGSDNSASAGSAAAGGSFASRGGGGSGGGGNGGGPSSLGLPIITAAQDLGPLSGLAIGHALVLLPIFAVLDVLALIALLRVSRRVWAVQVAD